MSTPTEIVARAEIVTRPMNAGIHENQIYNFMTVWDGSYTDCYFFRCSLVGGTFTNCKFTLCQGSSGITVIDNFTLKYCPYCDQHIPLDNFSRNARAADGLQSRCKTCFSTYYAAKKDHIGQQQAGYKRCQRQNNPVALQREEVRNALRRVLYYPWDHLSLPETGCQWNFLKEWLEFTAMMYNGRTTGLVIDHLYPVSRFDLCNPEERKMVNHWYNLRMITSRENQLKHHRDPTPAEISHQKVIAALFLQKKGILYTAPNASR